MRNFYHKITLAVLSMVGLLIVLSVAGAFCGADKAKIIFNSIPLALYWYFLSLLIITGILNYSFLQNHALFLSYFGFLLILLGGMWSSEPGHRIYNRLFGNEKFVKSYMLIPEGKSENYVTAEDFISQSGQLPFSVKLNDFHIEYDKTKKYIKNFCSDITVIDDGKAVFAKTIRVNKPLRYGGYHFYQYSYDSQMQQYAILLVASDNGFYAVYTGYWLLSIGIFWHFWFNILLKK